MQFCKSCGNYFDGAGEFCKDCQQRLDMDISHIIRARDALTEQMCYECASGSARWYELLAEAVKERLLSE